MENPKQQKNKKSFPIDKIVGVIAVLFVLYVLFYVVASHMNITLFVPSDAVEMTYPASILNGGTEEIAESMRGTDGVYRVKINEDESLSVKISPERYSKIKEAADNAAKVIPLTYISEETAVQGYEANEDNTQVYISVIKGIETLEKEVSDIVYILRLYHVCNGNYDVKINVDYTDAETGEKYMTEVYDIEGVLTTEQTV